MFYSTPKYLEMYKYTLFLFCLVFCFACKNDNKSSADTDVRLDSIIQQIDTTRPKADPKPAEYVVPELPDKERKDSIDRAEENLDQSPFKKLGCCAEKEKRQDDCCCKEVVKEYLRMMENGEFANLSLSEDVIFNLCKEIPKWKAIIDTLEDEPLF